MRQVEMKQKMQSNTLVFFALNALWAKHSTGRQLYHWALLITLRCQASFAVHVSAEQPERINDIICDVTHTGKQSVVCHNTSEKKTK